MEMIQKLIQDAMGDYGVDVTPVVSRPEPQFGDYATNVSLQLSKPLGRNPREIAEEIAGKLESTDMVKSVEVAGPGFINLWLSDSALRAEATRMPGLSRRGQTVVIETNNPNPFKAMHIGHAFNAILGDTIANLLTASGATVHRVSYHGDVGAHVGKSMYSLLSYVDGDISKLVTIPDDEHNTFMSRMYAEGSNAYKNDETAKADIDELSKQSFTLDDPLYKQIYEICKGWSFVEIDSLVARLGNQPIEKRYLESQSDEKGVPIVKANVPDVFQESNGALIFEGSKHGSFDNAYVTSRGLGLYGARDLGLMTLKHEDYHADKSYIVTDAAQGDYFKGVIAAAEQCLPELTGVTHNISTGTVKLSTGKMSSRTGDVLEVSWLFDQMSEAIKARGGEPIDEVIAGALRYQFLKVRVGSDVVFDVEDSVSIQGNSGPYLQYAHARARSILAKAELADIESPQYDPAERALLAKISEYPNIIERAAEDLAPHSICSYLYELAQVFNRFYEKNRVIDDPRQDIRLTLVALYADTLARGLTVLGIHAPDKL